MLAIISISFLKEQTPSWIKLEAKKHYIRREAQKRGECVRERDRRERSFFIHGKLQEVYQRFLCTLIFKTFGTHWCSSFSIKSASVLFTFPRGYIYFWIPAGIFFSLEKHLQRETDASFYPQGSFSSLCLWAWRC